MDSGEELEDGPEEHEYPGRPNFDLEVKKHVEQILYVADGREVVHGVLAHVFRTVQNVTLETHAWQIHQSNGFVAVRDYLDELMRRKVPVKEVMPPEWQTPAAPDPDPDAETVKLLRSRILTVYERWGDAGTPDALHNSPAALASGLDIMLQLTPEDEDRVEGDRLRQLRRGVERVVDFCLEEAGLAVLVNAESVEKLHARQVSACCDMLGLLIDLTAPTKEEEEEDEDDE